MMKKVIIAVIVSMMMAAFAEPIMNIKTSFPKVEREGPTNEAFAKHVMNNFAANFQNADKITMYASENGDGRISFLDGYLYVMAMVKIGDKTLYYGFRDDHDRIVMYWKPFDNYKEMRAWCERAGRK